MSFPAFRRRWTELQLRPWTASRRAVELVTHTEDLLVGRQNRALHRVYTIAHNHESSHDIEAIWYTQDLNSLLTYLRTNIQIYAESICCFNHRHMGRVRFSAMRFSVVRFGFRAILLTN